MHYVNQMKELGREQFLKAVIWIQCEQMVPVFISLKNYSKRYFLFHVSLVLLHDLKQRFSRGFIRETLVRSLGVLYSGY